MKHFIESLIARCRTIAGSFRTRHLWLGLLSLSLAAALISAIFEPPRRAATLWFPDARPGKQGKARAELRYVPFSRDVETTAASIVEELLLGPLEPTSSPVAAAGADLDAVIGSGKTLYVDLSASILFGRVDSKGVSKPSPLPPAEALGYIRKTLEWNFPSSRIVVTIEGREPSDFAFGGPASGKKE